MRRRVALAAIPVLVPVLLAACATNTADSGPRQIVVFFEDDSVALGPNALSIVQDAARVAQASPNAPVRVLGYVAPEPGETPIMALARARAEHVASELQRFGVAAARIRVQGRGAATFATEAPIEARRVEIRIGG